MADRETIELGLGLISIGRSWGYRKSPVPSAEQVQEFLTKALEAGIRVFDTAPSYGFSEERLGRFLHGLHPETRRGLLVATKAGEHWDRDKDTLRVDHSYDALSASLERSLDRLGSIDLLQLHKATAQNVKDPAVRRVLEHAKEAGVGEIGASVTDAETARLVLEDDLYQEIQFPFHMNNRTMEPFFEMAAEKDKRVLVNRPFGMGELLHAEETVDPRQRRVDAFRAIAECSDNCIVLSGTQNYQHLLENIEAFEAALERASARDAARNPEATNYI